MYIVSACQCVAEYTRNIASVSVELLVSCTRRVFVQLTIGQSQGRTGGLYKRIPHVKG